ncbi:putative transcriptional regulator YdeE [Elusimicrobium posterum]|uniref:GyrI-like domain-containing protein n=1 Tax=Elusimicrobium posterum TaxID=3116653 RepID=UPI003C7730D2
MNYRLEEKAGFRIIGIKELMSKADKHLLKKIPQMWDNMPQHLYAELLWLSDAEPKGILGICGPMIDSVYFEYWIAAASSKHTPPGLHTLEIPAGTWAIFKSVGPVPGTIQEVWKYIYDVWQPPLGYEHARTPEVEWYSGGNMREKDYLSEVWIPLLKTEEFF